MRGPQEEDSVGGDPDGSQMFDPFVRDVLTADQSALDDQAPKGVADEDDGAM